MLEQQTEVNRMGRILYTHNYNRYSSYMEQILLSVKLKQMVSIIN